MKRENTIKNLLDKYLEGETSINEEKILSDYFNSEHVKPEWEVYKSMFSFFQVTKEEQPTKTFVPKVRPIWKSWHNIAAVLMLALATTLFFKSQKAANQDLGTYQDPEVAFEETIKVFDLIGDRLNTGKKEMQHLNTLETTTTKYINLITP
jgi:hypothetical protein